MKIAIPRRVHEASALIFRIFVVGPQTLTVVIKPAPLRPSTTQLLQKRRKLLLLKSKTGFMSCLMLMTMRRIQMGQKLRKARAKRQKGS
jgi:hypothetical protein